MVFRYKVGNKYALGLVFEVLDINPAGVAKPAKARLEQKEGQGQACSHGCCGSATAQSTSAS